MKKLIIIAAMVGVMLFPSQMFAQSSRVNANGKNGAKVEQKSSRSNRDMKPGFSHSSKPGKNKHVVGRKPSAKSGHSHITGRPQHKPSYNHHVHRPQSKRFGCCNSYHHHHKSCRRPIPRPSVVHCHGGGINSVAGAVVAVVGIAGLVSLVSR